MKKLVLVLLCSLSLASCSDGTNDYVRCTKVLVNGSVKYPASGNPKTVTKTIVSTYKFKSEYSDIISTTGKDFFVLTSYDFDLISGTGKYTPLSLQLRTNIKFNDKTVVADKVSEDNLYNSYTNLFYCEKNKTLKIENFSLEEYVHKFDIPNYSKITTFNSNNEIPLTYDSSTAKYSISLNSQFVSEKTTSYVTFSESSEVQIDYEESLL